MVSVGNSVVGSGASLSLDARVAVGAGVFAVSAADTSTKVAPTPIVTDTGNRLPAYNAFEFSYRSDFGKIILLRQDVETGQEVTQVPTEYHLQQYAATQRQTRVQQLQKLFGGSPGEAPSSGKTVAVTTTAKAPASPSGLSAPPASQPAAPTVAPSTVATAAATHVDIKV